jgi:3-carboxy-cis,cis-muconate cycloisomerase
VSVVRQHSAALMDAMIADHERSTGPWEIEWLALPEAFCLLAGALMQTRFVLEGLEVDEANMRANIDLTKGLVMSEAVMMGLGPYIGREYAHDLVSDLCRQAIKTDRPLLDSLAEHPEINVHLDRAALAKLCDPANYLGQAGVMVDKVLARAKATARRWSIASVTSLRSSSWTARCCGSRYVPTIPRAHNAAPPKSTTSRPRL